MYRDLVYRPGEDSYDTRDLVFRPGVDTSAYEMVLRERPGSRIDIAKSDLVAGNPSYPGIDERPRVANLDDAFGKDFTNKIDQAGRVAKNFLDLYLLTGGRLDPSSIAGLNLPMVDPSDVDPGGPESPEAMARFAEYLRQRRERGDFERARQRLIQQGFPLGGV